MNRMTDEERAKMKVQLQVLTNARQIRMMLDFDANQGDGYLVQVESGAQIVPECQIQGRRDAFARFLALAIAAYHGQVELNHSDFAELSMTGDTLDPETGEHDVERIDEWTLTHTTGAETDKMLAKMPRFSDLKIKVTTPIRPAIQRRS